MKSKLNKFIYGSWSTSILFLLFGILLFIMPEFINSFIGYLLGTIVALSGIVSIINYFSTKI